MQKAMNTNLKISKMPPFEQRRNCDYFQNFTARHTTAEGAGLKTVNNTYWWTIRRLWLNTFSSTTILFVVEATDLMK